MKSDSNLIENESGSFNYVKNEEYNKYLFLGEDKVNLVLKCIKCNKNNIIEKQKLNKNELLNNEHCSCGFSSNKIDYTYLDRIDKKNKIKSKILGCISLVSIILLFLIRITNGPFILLSVVSEVQSTIVMVSIFIAIICGALAIDSFINLPSVKVGKEVSFILNDVREKNDIKSNKNKELILKGKIEKLDIINEKNVILKNSNINFSKNIILGFKNRKYLFWRDEKSIYFFPVYEKKEIEDLSISQIESVDKIEIPLYKIEYFNQDGELYRENKIEGGGGGGSSLGGAVAGAIIAGGAGAIVASRKKNEEIKSKLITHDTRKTILNYFDENNERQTLSFSHLDYQSFYDLIPEKKYEIVVSMRDDKIVKSSIEELSSSIITNKIVELSKLKDSGIITEQEFVKKKTELLSRL